MENRKYVNLDFSKITQTDFWFIQGDQGADIIEFSITDNEEPKDIDKQDVTIAFTKPNGELVIQDDTKGVAILDAKNGILECTLLGQVLACSGVVKCNVTFTEKEKILSTGNFRFTVLSNTSSTTLSKNIIPSLNRYLAIITANEETRQFNFNKNENIRQSVFNINEKNRKNIFDNNENIRKTDFEGIKTEYGTLKKSILAADPAANLQDQVNDVRSHLADIANDKLTPLTKSENVFSLPNCADGQLSFSLKGRTLKNEIINGDFSNGTNNWKNINISNSSILVKNNTLSFTPTSLYGQIYNHIEIPVNHKIYATAKIKTEKTTVNLSIAKAGGSNWVGSTPHNGSGSYSKLSLITTILSDFTSPSVCVGTYSKNDFDTIYVKEVMCIDLTAMFGAGNEPSKEWCDNNLSYFDGIKSVGELNGNKIEVLSRGKNLLPFKDNYSFNADEQFKVLDTFDWNGKESNVILSLDTEGEGTITEEFVRLRCTIGTKIIDSICAIKKGSLGNRLISTINNKIPAGTKKIILLARNSDSLNCIVSNIQLELGTQATSYTHYQGDKIDILTTHLFGIGSSIDEKGVATYGTGKTVFDGTNSWLLKDTDYGDMVRFDVVLENVKCNNVNDMPNVVCDKLKVYSAPIADNTEGFLLNNTTLYLFILKSKLSSVDVAGLKAYLTENPITVYYELADEYKTIEQLPQPLCLQSFKDGSMVVNSAIPPILEVNYPTSFATGIFENAKGVADNRTNIKDIFDALYLLTLEIENLKNNNSEEV